MRKSIISMMVVFAGIGISARAGQKEETLAFRVFNASGKAVDFSVAAEQLIKSDVVFFGELHNNPIAHWLQLRLTKYAWEKKKEKLVLAAEMFESDGQVIMNEYLEGKLSTKGFEDEMRLWPNYATDYKPLVELAKASKLRFICANVPRRYANMVYKSGIESLNDLSTEAKSFIAPLPIEYNGEIACYKDMLAMSGGHGGDNLPKAQAVKDATMAWFIKKNMNKGDFLIHFNGSWHSDKGEGIQYYLNKYAPELKRGSITTVSQSKVDTLSRENQNLADFIIVVADDMTPTH